MYFPQTYPFECAARDLQQGHNRLHMPRSKRLDSCKLSLVQLGSREQLFTKLLPLEQPKCYCCTVKVFRTITHNTHIIESIQRRASAIHAIATILPAGLDWPSLALAGTYARDAHLFYCLHAYGMSICVV